MLDLVLKLIGLLNDLANRRKEKDRFLFDRFIAPSFVSFEAIHKDYVDSILRYRSVISAHQGEFTAKHPVFLAIENDQISTGSLKPKLKSLLLSMGDERLKPYVSCILEYLFGTPESPVTDMVKPKWGGEKFETEDLLVEDHAPMECSTLRSGLYGKLEAIIYLRYTEELEKKAMAMAKLAEATKRIQSQYEKVADCFYAVQRQLLIPK